MKDKIKELIENIPKPLNKKKIKVICYSGAFNGSYLCGSLLYLKELENQEIIEIEKFSGSSIGSLSSLLYIIDRLDEADKVYKKIRKDFKQNFCLKLWEKILKEFFDELDDNIYLRVNNKLYINYYNVETNKEFVKYNYESNEDLLQTILNSTFIPYVMNGKISHNGNIDGFNPYIFKDRTVDDPDILFIRITMLSTLKKMFNIKRETNSAERKLEGILDTHKFFKGDSSQLCSWINKWGLYDYFIFRSRQIFWLSIVLICYIFVKIRPFIPAFIYNNKFSNTITEFLYKFYTDLFIIFYNS